MATMDFSDPNKFDDVVTSRAAQGECGTASEYIGELIRAGQKDKAWAILEAEILKGIDSGPAVPMTEEDWADIRAEVLRRCEARKAEGK